MRCVPSFAFVFVLASASFTYAQPARTPEEEGSVPADSDEGAVPVAPVAPGPAQAADGVQPEPEPAGPEPAGPESAKPEPAPEPARAPEPTPPPAQAPTPRNLFEWAGQTRTDAGYACVPHSALLHAGQGYVACGTSGVWVCRFEPSRGWALQEIIPVQGMVVGLRMFGAEVQAEVVHPVPVPLHSLRASPAAGLPADCDSLVAPKVTMDGLVVTLDPQSRHCFHRRQHVELLDEEGNVLSVARVARVSRDVRLTLGYHERVEAEQVATVRGTTARVTSSRVAPQRAESMWLARVHARPFFSPSPSGGLIADVTVEHVFRRKAFLRADATPLAVVAGSTSGFSADLSNATVGAAFAGVLGGVDTRLFALGAGIGVATVNAPDQDQRPGSGTAFPLYVRVGARDGLSFELRGDATLFLSSLHFTGVFGKLTVPFTHSAGLQLQAGGGPMGVSSGHVALRKLSRGNGGPGSLFWEVSIGGGSVFRDVCEAPINASAGFRGCFTREREIFNGMTVGFGLERRF